MLFAIDSVNANETLLPNITLGFDIRDTCYSGNIGVDEIIDMTNGSRDASVPTIGIVGAASSRVSIPVADLGSMRQILPVSFASTSPLLSNRVRYPFFIVQSHQITFKHRQSLTSYNTLTGPKFQSFMLEMHTDSLGHRRFDR